jgi:hypothetical protein
VHADGDLELDALILRRLLGGIGGARYVSRCVKVAEAVTSRRDGIAPPVAAEPIRRLLASACGSAEVLITADVAPSVLIDPIATEEVAALLGCTTRRARQICAAGLFDTANNRTGRWLVERDEVQTMARTKEASNGRNPRRGASPTGVVAVVERAANVSP